MKKWFNASKITQMILVFALLLTGVVLPAGGETAVRAEERAISDVREQFEVNRRDERVTPALQDLRRQAQNRFEPTDEVDIIIRLSNEAAHYRNVEGIRPMSAIERRDPEQRERFGRFADLAQAELLSEFRHYRVRFDTHYSYRLLLNGLSGRTDYATAETIARFPQVESVGISVTYRRPETEITPQLRYSGTIVGANTAHDLGYTGKKMVVAVLDTGFDVAHNDFKLEGADADNLALTQEAVEKLIQDGTIKKGKWFSNKFPFGYNYAMFDTAIEDTTAGSSHGQHVAGIIGANGDPEAGGVRGLAPHCQLLGMNVFRGNGTSDYIYVRAIEDAVALGADSVNMSLGSNYGVVSEISSSVIRAIDAAKQIGCVINIAAGNTAIGGMSDGTAAPGNPDYGLVGSPAVAEFSLAVASMNNAKITLYPIDLLDTDPLEQVAYNPARTVAIPYNTEMKIFDCGLGREEDFTPELKEKLKGNAALIERGDITFVEKINNAAAAGAVLAVIYNHEAGGESFVNMATDDTTIASLSIKRSDGLRMREYDGRLAVRDAVIATEYDGSLAMSEFSGWGLASNFDLKPEITAPGGNVYSTDSNNGYASMSGTSMATPHVAAGVALVHQRLKQDYPAITGETLYALTKNMLMSTAKPHVDRYQGDYGIYTSPRKQGAGVMYLPAALASDIVAVRSDDGIGRGFTKAVLPKVTGETFSFDVKLQNYGETARTFALRVTMTADLVEDGKNMLRPRALKTLTLGEVTVPGRTSATEPGEVVQTITLEADVMQDLLQRDMPNGYFLDGFVCFDSLDEAAYPSVSMPYVAFRGDFENLSVLEPFIYDFDMPTVKPQFYDPETFDPNIHFTSFFDSVDKEKDVVLGEVTEEWDEERVFDADKIAFSPNSDYRADRIYFRGVFYRHYKDLSFEIAKPLEDGTEESIKTFPWSHASGVKSYYEAQPGDPVSRYERNWYWDGRGVEDGPYLFKVMIKPAEASDDVDPQVYTQTIWRDTQAPILDLAVLSDDGKTVTVAAEDPEPSPGLRRVYLTYEKDGETHKIYPADGTFDFTLPDGVDLADIEVVADDYAYNQTIKNLKYLIDTGLMARLDVTGTTDDGSNPPAFEYRVIRLLDGGGEEVYENDALLPLGTYRVEITEWDMDFFCDQTEFELEFTEGGKIYTLEVPFRRDTRERIKIFVKSERGDGYTGTRAFVAESKTDGSIWRFHRNYAVANGYSVDVPADDYKVYAVDIQEGWVAKPDLYEITVDPDFDRVMGIRYAKLEELGAIAPVSKAGEEGLDLSAVTYKAYDASLGYEYGPDELNALPYAEYDVIPAVPDGYYAVPDHQMVELTAEAPNAAPVFTFYKKTDERKGSLVIKTVKSNPENTEEVEVTYEVKDYYGTVYTDLENLPYGTYYVTATCPQTYRIEPERAEFTLSAEAPNATLTFTLTRLTETGEEGTMNFQLEGYPGYGIPTPLVFHMTASDGTELDPLEIKRLSSYNRHKFPLDVYTITPVVPEGWDIEIEYKKAFYEEQVEVPLTDASTIQYLIVRYYKWLTVTFESNGGSEVESEAFHYMSAPSRPEDPVREGYRFAGWFRDEDLTNEYNFKSSLYSDTTLYAKWDKIPEYTVAFESNGGSEVESVAVIENETVAKPDDPVREGYRFLGWFLDEALTTPYDFDAPVTADLTLYAKWELIPVYTVTFESNGGSEVPAAEVEEDATVAKPDDPVREGYRFVGWFRDEALTTAYDFSAPVTSNLTLYAKWQANDVTLEARDENNALIGTVEGDSDSLGADWQLIIDYVGETETANERYRDYDVYLLAEGKRVQPRGEVAFRLLIPDAMRDREVTFRHFDKEWKVVAVYPAGTEWAEATVDHFSLFRLAVTRDDEPPQPPAPTTTEAPPVPTTTEVPPAPTTTEVPPAPTATEVPPAPTTTAVPPVPTTTEVPPAPTAPVTSAPTEPTVPSHPIEPTIPVPVDPTKPPVPSDPGRPTEPGTPVTGEHRSLAAILSLMMAGALTVLIRRRRDQAETER